jgi:hypothetical protein
MTTTNLADFGMREWAEVAKLTKAMMEQGLPQDFYYDEVTLMMNQNSGNVFFTNSEFQVAMMNGDRLEIFYTDFETGEKGFLDELSDESKERLGLLETSDED